MTRVHKRVVPTTVTIVVGLRITIDGFTTTGRSHRFFRRVIAR
jgi:hypothetical protein